MDKPRPKVALARQMRRQMTEPEYLLWVRLKSRLDDGLVFRRQKPFGPYILDFHCFAARLAVEVDGACHGEHAAYLKDAQRDFYLFGAGLFVYRIPAAEIYRNADVAADGVRPLALNRYAARQMNNQQDTPPPRALRRAVPLPTCGGEVQEMM